MSWLAADAAGGEDDRLRAELELPDGSRLDGAPRGASSGASTVPRTPVTVPPVTTSSSTRWRWWKVTSPRVAAASARVDERLHHPGAGAPGDVEARHRVAVPVRPQVAALGPADGRQERDAVPGQPVALLPGGELDVGARPPDRPLVLVVEPVEGGAALPVVPRQLEGVLHPGAPLLGAVDQEDAAERPERLAAEVGAVLLVDDQRPSCPGWSARGWRRARPGPPRRR